MLELSKDLILTSQKVFLAFIESHVEHSNQRLIFVQRLIESNWERFNGFAQGYLDSKDRQIDRLHMQKIAVMGQMAAGMAHEIRNPLASVKGFAQLIKQKLQDPVIMADELTNYLDFSIKEVNGLNAIVTDFLLLARKGDTSFRSFNRVDLKAVLHRVIGIVESFIVSENIQLTFKMTEDDLHTNGDASQLEQIFLNILKNSIDAIGVNGRIQIEAFCNEETIYVKVQDNGVGMPAEILIRIFEPFYTTKENGTGLGLPICKELIEQHYGKLWLDSKIGEGTMASILLPVHPH